MNKRKDLEVDKGQPEKNDGKKSKRPQFELGLSNRT